MRAPAKVNLCLRVLGRREDGFHQLWTIFDALEFGDELRYQPREGGGSELRVDNYDQNGGLSETSAGLPLPPAEDNLVLRAARAFAEATGLDASGTFFLDKHIPSGAGLGGGSSDAAAALRILCERHGVSPVSPRILGLAERLGADVPFFLHGGRAWADRRGDRIHPIEAGPVLHYLLLFPGFPSPTGEIFARHALLSAGTERPLGRGGFTPGAGDLSSQADRSAFEVAAMLGRKGVDSSLDVTAARTFLEHLDLASSQDRSRGPGAWTIGFFNDLEPAAFEANPLLGTLEGLLDQEGSPRFCLSGSGSTLFVASLDEASIGELERALSGFLANPRLSEIFPGARLIRTRSLAIQGR